MGLVFESDSDPVEVTNGETVFIKSHFSHDDKFKMTQAASRNGASIKVTKRLAQMLDASRGGELDTVPDDEVLMDVPLAGLTGSTEEAEWAALEAAITGWTFTYPETHQLARSPVPVTPENIRRLDDADYDIIKRHINALTASRDEESKVESGPPSSITSLRSNEAEPPENTPKNSRTSALSSA